MPSEKIQNNELIKYVIAQLNAGFNELQIKNAILSQGYSGVEAQDAINSAKKNQTTPQSKEKPNLKRSTLFTIWLVLVIIGNVFSIIVGILSIVAIILMPSLATLLAQNLNVPLWVLALSIVLGIVNIILTWFIFKWKKIGFYGTCVVSVISAAVVTLFTSTTVWNVCLGFLGPIISYLFLMKKLKYMN